MTKSVTIIGAGPAGLMAADVLSAAGVAVTVQDHMPAPARKFLLAGRGGLNLTHAEPPEDFLSRYGEARAVLAPAIQAFPPQALRDWCSGLGIETFVGSSGRVFPEQMKASPLLRALLRRLSERGVVLHTRQRWTGFTGDPTILAMGGASWPHLGSDATWVPVLRARNIRVNGFKPANGRFLVKWTPHFRDRFAGTPVKNVGLSYAGQRVRGEVMISQEGIEGGAIYALSRLMRDNPGEPLLIDLRPDLTMTALAERLNRPRGKESLSNYLRKAVGLSPVGIALLRESKMDISAEAIKFLPVHFLRPAGLARAISSAGGVAFSELDAHYQFRKVPGCYAVGEMLDWEAPTGGYLLQACFSTAVHAAHDMLKTLSANGL